MSEDENAIDLLYKALKELKDNPKEKINPNRVARKADISNSNIYKKTARHIKLKSDIKDAQKTRDKDLKIQKLETEVRKLTRQLNNAKDKISELKDREPEVVDNKKWINKLTEMYRMSDNLIIKNNHRKRHQNTIN